MPGSRSALAIVVLGLLTFGVVFTLLEFSRSQAAPAEAQTAPTAEPTLIASTDSLAREIDPGQLAVGLPIAGSEALLRDVQPGDRLDILASLSSPQDAQPITAIVVRGAKVLRPASASDPLLVEVPGPDAIAVAHLVASGTHLAYTVWSATSVSVDSRVQALDQATARRLLGLTVASEPTAAPLPTSVPTSTPAPDNRSGFLYQVQPGDTWQSVASLFGVSLSRLRDLNEASNEPDPVAGRLIFIPRAS